MKSYHMPDGTGIAGGHGYQDLPIRRVMAPHPTVPDVAVPAYEMEFEFEASDVIQIMGGGRLRICILGSVVVPIHVDTVPK